MVLWTEHPSVKAPRHTALCPAAGAASNQSSLSGKLCLHATDSTQESGVRVLGEPVWVGCVGGAGVLCVGGTDLGAKIIQSGVEAGGAARVGAFVEAAAETSHTTLASSLLRKLADTEDVATAE